MVITPSGTGTVIIVAVCPLLGPDIAATALVVLGDSTSLAEISNWVKLTKVLAPSKQLQSIPSILQQPVPL